MNLAILIRILETSVKNHGPGQPLTLGHLLNIVKMADRQETQAFEKEERDHSALLNELNPLGQE